MGKSGQGTEASKCFLEVGSSLKEKNSFNDTTEGKAASPFYPKLCIRDPAWTEIHIRQQVLLAPCELAQLHGEFDFLFIPHVNFILRY